MIESKGTADFESDSEADIWKQMDDFLDRVPHAKRISCVVTPPNESRNLHFWTAELHWIRHLDR